MNLNRAGIAVIASSLVALARGREVGVDTYPKNPGLPRNERATRGMPVLTGRAPEELHPDNRAARRRRFKARQRQDQRAAQLERARALSALKASRS